MSCLSISGILRKYNSRPAKQDVEDAPRPVDLEDVHLHAAYKCKGCIKERLCQAPDPELLKSFNDILVGIDDIDPNQAARAVSQDSNSIETAKLYSQLYRSTKNNNVLAKVITTINQAKISLAVSEGKETKCSK